MKNSEYWRGRFSLLERSTYKTAQAALREMEALYRQALYRTRKELDSWCTRFADDNGVSLTEARRLLGAKELEEFRWDVAQYIETAQKAGLDETWQRQLRNASAKVHISRLEAVETQIRQQIEELYAGQKARLTEAVRRAADDAYTGTLQEAAKGLDVNFKTVSLDKTQLDALTSKAWTTDDRTFRDRCWTNKNALVQAVHKGLTQGLLRGDSPAQLTDAIAKFSEMTESQALSLRDAHRSVLQLVLDSGTPDHEAGCFLMSDFSHTEPFISKSSGSIQFPATPQGAVGTIHSHPTGTSFSLGDILQFASDADSSIMTVVGNNGSVYLFQKTEDFDISGYLLFLNEQMELFPNRQEDAQEYLKFMEAVLHGAEKYGFDYKAF